MGQFTISGDTSGTLTLTTPAAAGTPTITFPTVSGNALASTAVNTSATSNTVNTKIAVNISGTVYYLLASTTNT
jgi:hypothetical protein